MSNVPARVVVGITGATGAVYGVRLLERLKASGTETHLVVSPAGVLNVHHELGLDRQTLEGLAHTAYHPCSMKTLASVAHGFCDNLLSRAADVTLKERRRLVMMVRETPFNLAHLRNMTAVTEMGAVVFPPLPAFYHRPQTIDELVDDTVERVLALIGVATAAPRAWTGL
jgi:4-hydroxy-3-polyprenylbenzoate decarboxylase